MTAILDRSSSPTGAGAGPLLEARGLVTGFGSTQVLHGVDLTVAEGQIAGIFGLNGAGKSVTIKTLSGLLGLWEGRVSFAGRDITGLTPEARVALGIGNVPQGRQVFPALTVEENLRLGAYTSRRTDRASYPDRLADIYDRFPVLATRRTDLAGTLSGGQQASLAVARALINGPRLVLVDEPSAGLAPVIVSELFDILRGVAESGVTMVLVEQNVSFGLRLVDHAHILQTGRVVYEGSVDELDQDRLASLLGIGRMLGRTTTAALATRHSGDDEAEAPTPTRVRRRVRPAQAKKMAAPKKKAAAPKRAPAKKKAAPKKKAAAPKRAPAKKKAAPKKKAAAKRRAR